MPPEKKAAAERPVLAIRAAQTRAALKSSTHRTQGQIAAETTAKMNEAIQKPAAKSLCRHKEWRQCNRSHTRQRIPPLHWPMPNNPKQTVQQDLTAMCRN